MDATLGRRWTSPLSALAMAAVIAVGGLSAACTVPRPQEPSRRPSTTGSTEPASPTPSPASTSSAWPELRSTQLIDGLDRPTDIVSPKDGTGRLFVTERDGRIRVIRDGRLLPAPALDIRALVSTLVERGLLGLAFPPDFATKRYAYIHYNDNSGATRIYRIGVDADDPDRFDRTTMQQILRVSQPFPNHNGGQIVFGPDGYLYIGLGDGGAAGDPGNRAQDRNNILGKILRIDVEATPGRAGYRIPRTNPYYRQKGRRGEIWARGLRNPWKFSFDRAGRMWIGDVGQDRWEEIDRLPAKAAGRNLGWPLYEGRHLFKARSIARSGFVWPITEVRQPTAQSVTGGFLYEGTANPSMRRIYFFGDFVTGRIWGLRWTGQRWERKELLDTSMSISTFGVDESGEIWVGDFGGGTIRRLTATP